MFDQKLFLTKFWLFLLGALIAADALKVKDHQHVKMHEAIRDQDLQSFYRLLGSAFFGDVNAANRSNTTLLHVACFYGSKAVVFALLDNDDLLLNNTNSAGETPLHFAALNSHVEILEVLLDATEERGGRLALKHLVEAQHRHTNQTALFYAVIAKAPKGKIARAVNYLIKNGGANIEHQDANGMQAIHFAMVNKHLDGVEILLKHEPRLSQSPCCGKGVAKTISHLAAENDIVEFLAGMREYFNESTLDGQGQNAACWAAINGSRQFGSKMVELGISINEGQCVYGDKKLVFGTPLQTAAYNRQKDYIRLLLVQPGVAENMIDERGSGSPIHAMALKSDQADREILAILHEANEEAIDSLDADGCTPFLVAIKSSSIAFAELLRKWRVRIKGAYDNRGYSAIHLAEDVATLNYLINLPPLGGQLDPQSKPGQMTPLHVAVLENKPVELINFLLDHDVNTLAVNDHGQSAAHLAVEENNLKALGCFLARRSFPFSIRDNAGRTPLLLASELGRVEAVRNMVLNNLHFFIDRLNEKMPVTGDAAVHIAAKSDHPKIVEMLLSRDENIAVLQNGKKQTPLHLAVTQKHLEVVKTLNSLTPGELSIQRDMHGRTPIHSLAMQCSTIDFEIGKELANFFNATQDIEDYFGETPLETAVKHSCVKMVELFLSNGMSCKRQNRQGYTPLHLAKRLGFDDLVDAMTATRKCSLDQVDACGSSVGQIDIRSIYVAPGTKQIQCEHVSGSSLTGSEGKKRSPDLLPIDDAKQKELFQACFQGDIDQVRSLLLTQQVDVNAKCDREKYGKISGKDFTYQINGFTCLMFAARNGNVQIVEMLIQEFNANVDEQLANGWTALHWAAQEGHAAAVRPLCEDGNANLETRASFARTPLMLAASKGKYEVAEYLLKRGAKVKKKDSTGKTALELANEALFMVDAGAKARTVELLKRHDGVDNAKQKELFEACYFGNTNMARYLLENERVDVNDKYDKTKHGAIGHWDLMNGYTCLIFAARFGRVETAEMLIREFKANADEQQEDGFTALHTAINNFHFDIVRLLCEDGKADLELKASFGRTALMLAASWDKFEIAEYLLKRGAKVNERSSYGNKTALALANGDNVKKLLKQYGGIE